MRNLKPIFHAGVCIALLAACNNKPSSDKAAADTTKTAAAAPAGPGSPIKYDSSKRYIFLTWDDSPQPPGTVVSKRIFKEQGVKATFFAVGMHYDIDPVRKRILDSIRNEYPQFLLANHSYSHGFRDNYNKFYTLVDSAAGDFAHAQQQMNIPLKIVRMPGRNNWAGKGEFRGPKSSEKVARRLDSLGYQVIGWDLEWQFVKGSAPKQGAAEMVRMINDKFESGYTNQPNTVVILAHDRMFGKAPYTDSLARFITLLKQDPRNVFETIDHYPSVMNK